MNSAMKKTKAVPRSSHLLLVGGSRQYFIHLRELLTDGASRHWHLDHLATPADLLNQNGQKRYDVLLCSSESTDDHAFQLLRQVRQRLSGVPLIFLSDPVSKSAIAFAMQAGAEI